MTLLLCNFKAQKVFLINPKYSLEKFFIFKYVVWNACLILMPRVKSNYLQIYSDFLHTTDFERLPCTGSGHTNTHTHPAEPVVCSWGLHSTKRSGCIGGNEPAIVMQSAWLGDISDSTEQTAQSRLMRGETSHPPPPGDVYTVLKEQQVFANW